MVTFHPNTPGYRENPYPTLERLRAREPVHRSMELDAWVLTSYEACRVALQDDAVFSNDPAHDRGRLGTKVAAIRDSVPLGRIPILANSDAPDHARLRAIVSRAFTPRAMEVMRGPIEAAVDALIARRSGKQMEVMSGLAEPLVVSAVMAHLAVPLDDRAAFRRATMAMMRARVEGPAHVLAAVNGYRELRGMFRRWAELEIPETTVLGTLLRSMGEPAGATVDEAIMLLTHISTAGNGPTACGLGNLVLALGEHPEAQQALLEDGSLIAAAVEEGLRFDSPTHVVARFAKEEAHLGGRQIRSGQAAYCVLSGANRDPGRFPRPDEFRMDREEGRQLSFGLGAHYCLGAPLARLELEAALAGLLREFAPFRVVAMARGGTFLLRGPMRVIIERA